MPALLRLLNCGHVIEYLSIEYPRQHKMIADVVARLADGRILHLEFQVKNDPDMHWRCFHYFGAIQQRWPQAEVIQVVIYLGGDLLTMQSSIDRPTCRFSYEILNLQEVPAQVFLDSPRSAERVLAVVSNSSDPRATIRSILASWKKLPENELRENVDRLRTLSQLRKREIMTIEEVKHMPFELDITESEIYKMGQVQGIAEGKAEGRVEGISEGKVEGRVEGARQVLVRLLETRFGPLIRADKKKIAAGSLTDLEHWTDRSVTAEHVGDIFIKL